MLPEGLGMNLIESPRYSREVKIVTENKTVTEIIMKAFPPRTTSKSVPSTKHLTENIIVTFIKLR